MNTFGSLFSGIGGMDLGLERAGWECRWQVEVDPFCRRVLEKHWPDVPKHADIREVDWNVVERVDLVAGGFPCQDISYAGYGAGISGERSGLWYEFVKAVRLVGPRLVLVENVAALLDRGMGEVLGTLAALGFDAEWSSVSACSVGAPHMRRRVFIVAHADSFDGWPRLRDTDALPDGTLQAEHGGTGPRARFGARLANPSALYGGADGVPFGMERNRGIGNAVLPDVAEWIGRRLLGGEHPRESA